MVYNIRLLFFFVISIVYLSILAVMLGPYGIGGYKEDVQILAVASWILSFFIFRYWGVCIIEFFARKLTKTEKNESKTKKEIET